MRTGLAGDREGGVPFFVITSYSIHYTKLYEVSVQGEIFYSLVNDSDSHDRHFWGAYAQAGWVVTGESRGYDAAGSYNFV